MAENRGVRIPSVWTPRAIKFSTVAPNIFSIITYENVYQLRSTEQKAPGNSEADRSLHNCGSTILTSRIRRWFTRFFYKINEREAKGKGTILPITGHEGPEGERRYSSTLSLTSALDGVGGQRHAPAALPPGKRPGTHCTCG
jgi:hypothetical protein